MLFLMSKIVWFLKFSANFDFRSSQFFNFSDKFRQNKLLKSIENFKSKSKKNNKII